VSNQDKLAFFEVYGDELFKIKEYIIEEKSGNNANRRKLNRAITNIRLQCGKIINQKLKLKSNSEKILQYVSTVEKLKRKLITYTIISCLTLIIILGIIAFFQETLLLDIITSILFALLVVFVIATFYFSLKLSKTYNDITKQYIIEYFQ
jgi:hypothetical protein